MLYGSVQVGVEDRSVSGVALTLRPGPVVRGRAEFDGTASRPVQNQWASISVDLEAANGAAPLLRVMAPGQFAPDAQFKSQSLPPGAYFVRIASPRPGWAVKNILADGVDVMETPLDLTSDVTNVVVTFTDHAATITGNVAGSTASATVLLFPANHDAWTNYGRASRRFVSARASNGAFTFAAPPAGSYYLIAVADEDASDWQDPLVLEKLTAIAEHIDVKDGETMTKSLTVRKIR